MQTYSRRRLGHHCEQYSGKSISLIFQGSFAFLVLFDSKLEESCEISASGSAALRTSCGLHSCRSSLRFMLLFWRELLVMLSVIFSTGAGLLNAALMALHIS